MASTTESVIQVELAKLTDELMEQQGALQDAIYVERRARGNVVDTQKRIKALKAALEALGAKAPQ